MIYTAPGQAGALVSFKSRYDNFIGGDWVAPRAGRYFENISPVDGRVFCEVARSDAADIELAWTRPTRRSPAGARPASPSAATCCCASPIASNRTSSVLAVAETWRTARRCETLAADLPLVVDHFRYFAGCIRAQEAPPPSWTRTPSATTSRSPSAWSARSSVELPC
jgi:aldehyde dehydrogenase